MNVLFVITNINGTYSDAYSFGLASIASITRDKGFDYEYAVINTYKDYNNFFDLVGQIKPKIIAYTSVSSQFKFIIELSQKIDFFFQGSIIQVCGGIHPTIFPECLFEAPSLDGIFVGEGEYAFSDFLDKMQSNQNFKDVNNFCYIQNGKLVKNPLYLLEPNIDKFPFPEREKYGYERFIKKNGYATFIFTRGCPYSCSFCSNHAIAKAYQITNNKPRSRSPHRCIDEIKEIRKRYKVEKIYVGDDTFGLNKQWAEQFCTLYAREIALPLIVQLRVNMVNEELMTLLKLAGCIHVTCGVESGNSYIRNEILNRHISDDQIIKAFILFKKYGMTTTAINIIGTPHETIDNIWDTIKLNRKINPTNSGINIFYPYRGTKLGDYCFEKKLVDVKFISDFSKERRESILDYPEDFKRLLEHFYDNWDWLIYKYRPYRFFYKQMTKFTKNKFPRLWNFLRYFKGELKKLFSKANG